MRAFSACFQASLAHRSLYTPRESGNFAIKFRFPGNCQNWARCAVTTYVDAPKHLVAKTPHAFPALRQSVAASGRGRSRPVLGGLVQRPRSFRCRGTMAAKLISDR